MRRTFAALVVAMVAGCGGNENSTSSTPTSHAVGGSITGLTVQGLVLANGVDAVSPSLGDSNFRFITTQAEGSSYNVTVRTQPPGLSCSVSGGAGTVGTTDVSTVAVACSPVLYSIGGSVIGLSGAGLVLANGSDSINVATGSTGFDLPGVTNGTSYRVTVQVQPSGQSCSLASATGTVQLQSVSNIQVYCRQRMLYVASDVSNVIGQLPIDAAGSPSTASAVSIASDSFPRRLALSPDGTRLYVAAAGAETIDIFLVGTDGKLTSAAPVSVATGGIPTGLAITPNGKYAYVSSARSSSVWMYAIGTSGELNALSPASIAAAPGTYGLAVSPNGKWLYAVGGGTVSMFSIGVNGVLVPLSTPSVQTGTAPYNIAITPDGRFAYSINNGDDAIRAFSIQADGSLARISIGDISTGGSAPTDMVFSSDGRSAYVPNFYGNSVAQYSVGNDGTLIPMSPATVPSGDDGPATLAVDVSGGILYVGHLRSNSIAAFKINPDGTLADTPFTLISTAGRPYHLIAP